jgi:soluble lytic murein transglycosylase-like protein
VLTTLALIPALPADAVTHRMVGKPWHPTGQCAQYYFIALYAGWSQKDWPTLDRIIWRESRCLPDACGETNRPELRRCRDWGLTQINDRSWKRTVRELGLEMEQMMDPYWNLWFAHWLYDYSLETTDGDCGWIQWSFNCK